MGHIRPFRSDSRLWVLCRAARCIRQAQPSRSLLASSIEAYVAHLAKFARHFGRSPEELGPEEIRQYQVFLVQQKKVSWSYFNQAVCSLRWF